MDRQRSLAELGDSCFRHGFQHQIIHNFNGIRLYEQKLYAQRTNRLKKII